MLIFISSTMIYNHKANFSIALSNKIKLSDVYKIKLTVLFKI